MAPWCCESVNKCLVIRTTPRMSSRQRFWFWPEKLDRFGGRTQWQTGFMAWRVGCRFDLGGWPPAAESSNASGCSSQDGLSRHRYLLLSNGRNCTRNSIGCPSRSERPLCFAILKETPTSRPPACCTARSGRFRAGCSEDASDSADGSNVEAWRRHLPWVMVDFRGFDGARGSEATDGVACALGGKPDSRATARRISFGHGRFIAGIGIEARGCPTILDGECRRRGCRINGCRGHWSDDRAARRHRQVARCGRKPESQNSMPPRSTFVSSTSRVNQ